MRQTTKKINVDLDFIVNQVDDNTFLCLNLPDRNILITVDSYSLTYTTTFKQSEFSFSYKTKKLSDHDRREFICLTQIKHGLRSCFLNYVDESYARSIFSNIPWNVQADMDVKQVGQLYYFYISITYLDKKCHYSISESYIYDDLRDDLLKYNFNQPLLPTRLSKLFQYNHLSHGRVIVYESITTDAFFIHVKYTPYQEDIIAIYSNQTLNIIDQINNKKLYFEGDCIVWEELEKMICQMIIKTPTEELRTATFLQKMDLDTLTMNDIKVLDMFSY